jgi:hypothetical protein
MLDVKTAFATAGNIETLSLKKLGALPKVKIGEAAAVCVVYGFVTGLIASHDDRGVKVKFFGDFLVYEAEGQKRAWRSKAMTFPPSIADILVEAETGDGRCAEFGFRIGVKGDDSVLGFHYTVERFIGLETFSPLERLIQRTTQQSE